MNLDIKKYLESGIIEEYCMGMLSASQMQEVETIANTYPEIKNAISDCQETLAKYAYAIAKKPPFRAKKKLLDTIDNLMLEETISLEKLPLLSKYSNSDTWLRFAKTLLPVEAKNDIHLKILRNDNEVFLSILWLKTNVPHEVHNQEKESFLILEGMCECYMGDQKYTFGPGDFFEVPLNVQHDVKILTPKVLAILQRIAT